MLSTASGAPAAPTTGPTDASSAASETVTPPTSYFPMFETCGCGHSSAWHSGAWVAWRSGAQVVGGCELGRDGGAAAPVCACGGFFQADAVGPQP